MMNQFNPLDSLRKYVKRMAVSPGASRMQLNQILDAMNDEELEAILTMPRERQAGESARLYVIRHQLLSHADKLLRRAEKRAEGKAKQ